MPILAKHAWELVVEEIVEKIVAGWDRYGAPSVAKLPEGPFYAHYVAPGGEGVVEAETKRQAYQEARKLWLRSLLDW